MFIYQCFVIVCADPELIVELYERDFDQDEMLGINDMKTENYAETTWQQSPDLPADLAAESRI